MSGSLTAPVSAEEFSLLIESFAPVSSSIALAVSGGPDSMALAFCVARWAQRERVAFIVEHGLRAESAAEAAEVKARLCGMGFSVEILPWTHGQISGRVHEKARQARYDLLIDACRRQGASDLLLAHHAGDQAETVLMRLAKGSGVDGLAGIPPSTVRDGIRLLRPFLSLSKERLIATCAAGGVAYVSDPSNASDKYARGRLRKILPLLAAEGLTEGSLNALSLRAREAKEALDFMARDFLSKSAQVGLGGSVRFERDSFRRVPRAIALRALAGGLRFVHDGDYPPEYAPLSFLLDEILGEREEGARTLYGCMASVSKDRVALFREPSAAREVATLLPGQTVLWDARWRVSSDPSAPSATVRALGFPPHQILDALAPDLRHRIPQGRIRATLPAVWVGDVLVALPVFGEKSAFGAVFRKEAFP